MVELKMDVFGEMQIARTLSRFGEGIEDFRPAFRQIISMLEATTVEHFASEGGGKWEPLSPKYAEWKARHFPGQPIMIRTGDLYESLASRTGNSIRKLMPMEMRWGTEVEYARFHQLGRGVPRRKVIDMDEDTKLAIMKELHRYVVAMAQDKPYA